MKKLSVALAFAAVLALALWAMSSLSTGMVRLLGFVDAIGGGEAYEPLHTAEAPAFELTDQDYDVLDIPADAPESTRAPAFGGEAAEDEADVNPLS